MKRQTYSQRYPWRNRVANTVALFALATLTFPFLPVVEINIRPQINFAKIVYRGSGR